MLLSTVSQHKTIISSLVVAAVLQCLLGVVGACPSCNASMLLRGQSDTEAGDVTTLACLLVTWQTGDSSDGRSCTCVCRTLKMHHELLRLLEDLTKTRTRGGEPAPSSPVGSGGRQELSVRHAFALTGFTSSAQRCALDCRFLL